jgi:hypothetical protein
MAAVADGFRATSAPHLFVNVICLSGALFVYNVLSVVRHHLGAGGLLRLFTSPVPREHAGGAPTPTRPREAGDRADPQ